MKANLPGVSFSIGEENIIWLSIVRMNEQGFATDSLRYPPTPIWVFSSRHKGFQVHSQLSQVVLPRLQFLVSDSNLKTDVSCLSSECPSFLILENKTSHSVKREKQWLLVGL